MDEQTVTQPADELRHELTVAALTGWSRLTPDRVVHLVRLATRAGRLDQLLGTPGLLADVDGGALLSTLSVGNDRSRLWAHVLSAAGLPRRGTDPAEQRDLLRVVAAGFPVRTRPTTVRDDTDDPFTVDWSTVPTAAHVPLTSPTRRVHVVEAVHLPDGRCWSPPPARRTG